MWFFFKLLKIELNRKTHILFCVQVGMFCHHQTHSHKFLCIRSISLPFDFPRCYIQPSDPPKLEKYLIKKNNNNDKEK